MGARVGMGVPMNLWRCCRSRASGCVEIDTGGNWHIAREQVALLELHVLCDTLREPALASHKVTAASPHLLAIEARLPHQEEAITHPRDLPFPVGSLRHGCHRASIRGLGRVARAMVIEEERLASHCWQFQRTCEEGPSRYQS